MYTYLLFPRDVFWNEAVTATFQQHDADQSAGALVGLLKQWKGC